MSAFGVFVKIRGYVSSAPVSRRVLDLGKLLKLLVCYATVAGACSAMSAQVAANFSYVLTTVGGNFSGPYAVAADGSGDVFVADTGNDRIVEVPAGCLSTACQKTVLSLAYQPAIVAVDSNDNLYVAGLGSGSSSVLNYPWTGSAYGSPVTVASSLSEVTDIAIDSGGDVFITNFAANYVLEEKPSRQQYLHGG